MNPTVRPYDISGADLLQVIIAGSGVYPRLLLTPVRFFLHRLPPMPLNVLEIDFEKLEDAVDYSCSTGCVASEQSRLHYTAPFKQLPFEWFTIRPGSDNWLDQLEAQLAALAAARKKLIGKDLPLLLEKIAIMGGQVTCFAPLFSSAMLGVKLSVRTSKTDDLLTLLQLLEWNGSYQDADDILSSHVQPGQEVFFELSTLKNNIENIGIRVCNNISADYLEELTYRNHLSVHQSAWLQTWKRQYLLPAALSKHLSEKFQRDIVSMSADIQGFQFNIGNSGISAKGLLTYEC